MSFIRILVYLHRGREGKAGSVGFHVVPEVNLISPLPLHLREANIDLDLLLGREFPLNLCLESAQEEWSEDCMQPVHKTLVLQLALVEPGIKILSEGERERGRVCTRQPWDSSDSHLQS